MSASLLCRWTISAHADDDDDDNDDEDKYSCLIHFVSSKCVAKAKPITFDG